LEKSITSPQLPEGVPPLTQYYFYLTAGCNLACQHCWLSPSYQKDGGTGGHLEYQLFELALDEAIPLGLNSVKLTGGEPLLHPDFIPIVDLLKEKELGLTIETNGTLVTAEIARHLRQHSTLGHISVSVDGDNADTHDRFRSVSGSFERAVDGIKYLVAEGYRPQVIMSLHHNNVDEIAGLVSSAQEWGAGSVKFNLVQPAGRGEGLIQRGQVLDINRLVALGKWVENDLQQGVSIPLHYSWPRVFHSLDYLLNRSDGSCSIHNILGVLANGTLAMCGIGMEVPDLVYGQLGVDRVADVWANNPVLTQLRQDIPANLEGVCGACLFKNQCLGSCVANNYLLSGHLTAPYWFCQQALDAGLLPLSRTRAGAPAQTL